MSSSEAIPISRAMAVAVCGWSPVIITTRMPAARHLETASLASCRGGSRMFTHTCGWSDSAPRPPPRRRAGHPGPPARPDRHRHRERQHRPTAHRQLLPRGRRDPLLHRIETAVPVEVDPGIQLPALRRIDLNAGIPARIQRAGKPDTVLVVLTRVVVARRPGVRLPVRLPVDVHPQAELAQDVVPRPVRRPPRRAFRAPRGGRGIALSRCGSGRDPRRPARRLPPSSYLFGPRGATSRYCQCACRIGWRL